MAARKEAEAAQALARRRRQQRGSAGTAAHKAAAAASAPGGGGTGCVDVSEAAAGSEAGASSEAGDTAAAAEAAPEDVRVLQRRVAHAEREALRARFETAELRAQVQRLRSNGGGGGGGGGGEAEGGGGGAHATRMAAHVERLSGQLRHAKATAAQALADRATLGQQLLEQQRLQRQVKVRSLADREKLTSLEVKLRTRGSGVQGEQGGEETAEVARIR